MNLYEKNYPKKIFKDEEVTEVINIIKNMP